MREVIERRSFSAGGLADIPLCEALVHPLPSPVPTFIFHLSRSPRYNRTNDVDKLVNLTILGVLVFSREITNLNMIIRVARRAKIWLFVAFSDMSSIIVR